MDPFGGCAAAVCSGLPCKRTSGCIRHLPKARAGERQRGARPAAGVAAGCWPRCASGAWLWRTLFSLGGWSGGNRAGFPEPDSRPGLWRGGAFIWYLPYGFCVALRLGNELCRARVFGEYRVTVAHPCAAYFCRGVAADRVHWFPSSGFSW